MKGLLNVEQTIIWIYCEKKGCILLKSKRQRVKKKIKHINSLAFGKSNFNDLYGQVVFR